MANTSASPLLYSVDQTERSPSPLPPYRTRSNSEASSEASLEDRGAVHHSLTSRSPVAASSHALHSPKTPAFEVTTEEHTTIPGWPAKPRRLKEGWAVMVLLRIVDVIVMIAPVYFIVLAALASRLDGQPVLDNSLGRKVVQMSKLGPTMFPIMFTAVAGRSMKAIARFCAERESKFGVLELLLASQTVWGTFESQVLLRRFTVIGAHLLILWSLSPLGGQASLRLLVTTSTSTNSTSNIKYLPTTGMSLNQTLAGMLTTSDPGSALSVTNSLYSANLLVPESVKVSSQDTWGNIKVPKLSTIQNISRSTDGWATVPTLSSPENFTTLAGLPISGTTTGANESKTFFLEYSYMNMECSSEWKISGLRGNWTDYLGVVWSSTNGSGVFFDNQTRTATSFFMDTNLPFDKAGDRFTYTYLDQNSSSRDDPILQARRNVLFGSEYYGSGDTDGYDIYYRNCSIWSEYVEAQTTCSSNTCGVTAIRPSVKYANRNSNLTPLDLSMTSYYLFKDLPLATGSMHDSDASPSELFIRGADTPFISNSSSVPDIATVPADTFASRLALLINTYYQLSLSPMSFVGNLPDPEDSSWSLDYTVPYPIQFRAKVAPFLAMNATAVVVTSEPIYACNYVWFAVLLASSIVLLLTGLAGAVLKYRCLAPDMMGFVASLTYDNPHVNLPPGGGTLDAMDRARLLRDVRVKIGDVQMDKDVGHVVFATTGGGDSIGGLSRTRTYV